MIIQESVPHRWLLRELLGDENDTQPLSVLTHCLSDGELADVLNHARYIDPQWWLRISDLLRGNPHAVGLSTWPAMVLVEQVEQHKPCSVCHGKPKPDPGPRPDTDEEELFVDHESPSLHAVSELAPLSEEEEGICLSGSSESCVSNSEDPQGRVVTALDQEPSDFPPASLSGGDSSSDYQSEGRDSDTSDG